MADKVLAHCSGLSKSFGGVVAVNNLSFHIHEREILGLIGPNGAGKTTVFNLMTGFYKPTSGTVCFRDIVLTSASPPEIVAAGIARTFQNIRLFSNLSVLDNVLPSCTAAEVWVHPGAPENRADPEGRAPH